MSRLTASLMFGVALSGATLSRGQTIIYVDDSAPGANDGTSWTDAYRELQDGLGAAQYGDEIHVAQGTYTPDRGSGDRSATFRLLSGVALRGGYVGYGAPEPDERDLAAYETILSGDLNGDDDQERLEQFIACYSGPGENVPVACEELDVDGDGDVDGDDLLSVMAMSHNWDNSYHVVTGSGINEAGILDGFIITGGNADSGSLPHNAGGGMRTHLGSPTVIDCTFVGNIAHYGGAVENYNGAAPTFIGGTFMANASTYRAGGMHNNTSHPTLVDCTFTINAAENSGGGMRNCDGSNPRLVRCIFAGNRAEYGGGMVNDESNPTLHECTFSGNYANGTSGGMHNWHSDPSLAACTFSGNSAGTAGGGMYSTSGTSSPLLTNCILWGNTDQGGTGETAQIHGGAPTVLYSCIQGLDGLAGNGNIGGDPLFMDIGGMDGVPGTKDDNLRPLGGSPCIDAGDNTLVPFDIADLDHDGNTTERTPLDLDGGPRFVDDPHTPDTGVSDLPDYAPVVDMGAYEFIDCNENDVPDVQDLAVGTSYDCNQNAVPDECDTAGGTSQDCDENGVPDECEDDADGDGVIDGCDGCPNDHHKIEPGICGCGMPDDDTDGDGAEDCNDPCPFDGNKWIPGDGPGQAPGQCGCGLPDTDTDGDGSADCIDACPGVDNDTFPGCAQAIPTISAWGLVVLTLLILVVGKLYFGRRMVRCSRS